MNITKSQFVTTVASAENILNTGIAEFAFVGRSNAGKSSLINALTNRNSLAKTSGTPGKTKHINYFLINDTFHIVDLPGYGYHKASKSDESRWTNLIDEYLMNSKELKCVFVLMDIRHKPSEQDKQMLAFLHYYQVPFIVIATKADKFSKSQRHGAASKLASELGLGTQNIIATSASEKLGLQQVRDKIQQFLGQGQEN